MEHLNLVLLECSIAEMEVASRPSQKRGIVRGKAHGPRGTRNDLGETRFDCPQAAFQIAVLSVTQAAHPAQHGRPPELGGFPLPWVTSCPALPLPAHPAATLGADLAVCTCSAAARRPWLSRLPAHRRPQPFSVPGAWALFDSWPCHHFTHSCFLYKKPLERPALSLQGGVGTLPRGRPACLPRAGPIWSWVGMSRVPGTFSIPASHLQGGRCPAPAVTRLAWPHSL